MMPFCNSIRNIWRSGTRFRTQTKNRQKSAQAGRECRIRETIMEKMTADIVHRTVPDDANISVLIHALRRLREDELT